MRSWRGFRGAGGLGWSRIRRRGRLGLGRMRIRIRLLGSSSRFWGLMLGSMLISEYIWFPIFVCCGGGGEKSGADRVQSAISEPQG